ncbi:glycosyltransferase family 2 protein [Erythrobacter litoralis]|uniref:glycosyltransferase family 2 protein n=1 Tax=Erythrobacter litoralis TaxID=39960 RepID=UPI00243584FE|nr:glycosyltransferase family 2 protein [Erythrobacter litoralis]
MKQISETFISQPEISVCIACRNEEANAPAIAAAVIAEMERVDAVFDIIFIDNDSSDRTVATIKDMCSRDPRIKLIVNTRNFGQMRSPTHAIYEAGGSAVISMCADFQDSPALLPEFVRRWRSGVPLVLGVRKNEKNGPILRFFRNLSYSLHRRFGEYPVIPNATGFGIYDRKVVEALRRLNEPEPFVRGMLVETGYKLETIPFDRPVRKKGKSNNNFFTLLDFALNGLAGSSKGLLRAPLYVAFFLGLLTFFSLIGAALSPLWDGSWQFWLFAAVLEGQFTLMFLFFGLLGVQVALVSERTRNQPLVIERERVNFPKDYRSHLAQQ